MKTKTTSKVDRYKFLWNPNVDFSKGDQVPSYTVGRDDIGILGPNSVSNAFTDSNIHRARARECERDRDDANKQQEARMKAVVDKQTMERRLGTHDPNYQSSYLNYALETHRMKQTIRLAEDALRGIHDHFQAFAFRGLSGALIAPLLAVHFDKTLIAVRKKERCHGSSLVLGDRAAKSYLIVDDQISSGTTIRWIHKYIKEWAPEMTCFGFLGINSLHVNSSVCAGGFKFPAILDFKTLQVKYLIDTPPTFKEGAGLSVPDSV